MAEELVSTVAEIKGSETRDEDRVDESCSRTSIVMPVWPSKVDDGSLYDTPLTGVPANCREVPMAEPLLAARAEKL